MCCHSATRPRGVEAQPDHVEAKRAGAAGPAVAGSEPGGASDRSLCRLRGPTAIAGRSGPASAGRSQRLDLDEHQRSPVERDDVHLAADLGGPDVARDDPPPAALQLGDQILGAASSRCLAAVIEPKLGAPTRACGARSATRRRRSTRTTRAPCVPSGPPRARQHSHLRADRGRGARRTVEVDVALGAAVVRPRRASRCGGARVARARASGHPQLGLRVPATADHRQPRARRPAQGRPRLRPGDRRGAPGGLGQLPPDGSATWRWPASLRWTARSGPCRGPWRWRRRARQLEREAIAVPAPNAPGGRPRPASPRVVPLVRLEQLRSWARRRSPRSPLAELARKRPRAVGAGSRRPAGAAVPALRARGGGGGRPQPADHRPARGRKVAGRPAPAVDHAPARGVRGDGGAADRERLRALRRPDAPPTRPFRAPHHTISTGRAGGRGHAAAGRRGDAVPPRRALPRRARRVLALGARGAATASRGGPGDDLARVTRSSFPAGSCSSRPPIRVPAAGARSPGSASASRRLCAATAPS